MKRIKPGMLARLRWSIRTGRKQASAGALLRLWWADFVVHPLFEIGERCQDCGRGFPAWEAADDLYAEVYGTLRGILCPGCFDGRAAARGVRVRFEARRFTPAGPCAPTRTWSS